MLKDHANLTTDVHRANILPVDIYPFNQYLASETSARRLLVHTIEAAHKCGLATPGRPDQRRDRERLNGQGNILQRLFLAVPGIELSNMYRHTLKISFYRRTLKPPV